MSAGLFYTPAAVDLEVGQRYELDGPEGHHGVAVRRLGVGELVVLSDGAGTVLEGEVSAVDRGHKTFQVRILSHSVRERPSPRLLLIQALIKDRRLERTLEMAIELGVAGIAPWQAERSVVRWEGQRAQNGCEKWRRVCRSAAQQARRPWIPTVAEPVSTVALGEQVNREPGSGTVLVLWERARSSLPEALALAPVSDWIAVVVGPEGGLSDREIMALGALKNAQFVSLGATILRAATAGVAALAAIPHMLERRGGAT